MARKITPAQRASVEKYVKENYDKVLLRIRKDANPTREQILTAATELGESMTGYILKAVKDRMEREEL